MNIILLPASSQSGSTKEETFEIQDKNNKKIIKINKKNDNLYTLIYIDPQHVIVTPVRTGRLRGASRREEGMWSLSCCVQFSPLGAGQDIPLTFNYNQYLDMLHSASPSSSHTFRK